MKKIKHGKYVLTPYSEDTHGHFTHYYAAVWKPYLVKFMAGLPPPLKPAPQPKPLPVAKETPAASPASPAGPNVGKGGPR